MIDLKFLRENPEIVKQNIKNKFQAVSYTHLRAHETRRISFGVLCV